MALLGDLVKNTLAVKERITLDNWTTRERQSSELKWLLELERNTPFG